MIPSGLPEIIDTKSVLTSIIVKVVYQASVGHAAVNFLQFDYGCFLPNAPGVLHGSIPTKEDKESINEDYIKNCLPGRDKCLEQAGAAFVLSEFADDEIFLLPKKDKTQPKWLFTDPEVKLVFEKFQDRLQQIEDWINERNNDLIEKGQLPYETLRPSQIPYGIAI